MGGLKDVRKYSNNLLEFVAEGNEGKEGAESSKLKGEGSKGRAQRTEDRQDGIIGMDG